MTGPLQQKKVALYHRSDGPRNILGDVLAGMGYQVKRYDKAANLSPARRQSAPVDLLVVHSSVLGETYPELLVRLQQLQLRAAEAPPFILVTPLLVSQEARQSLEDLGVGAVFMHRAPLMELLFAVNRALFPKMRELRRYTRVFGGFPAQFLYQGEWRDGDVYNISNQGVFIKCEQPPPENTRLRVRFSLPGGQEDLVVEAHVNWIHESGTVQDPLSPAGMGVSFLVLGQEESTSIALLVADRFSENDSVS